MAASTKKANLFKSFGAISKALNVLEFVVKRGDVQLNEIVQSMGLPRSTLHRLLNILVADGFMERTRHGSYRGSLKLWELGTKVANYDFVREAVIPVLRELVDETGETAKFAVYERGWSVYVAEVAAKHPISAGNQVGLRTPAYASATGRAVLAWRKPEEIAAVGAEAHRLYPGAPISAKALLAEAEKIRRVGFAVARGEWFPEVWSFPFREGASKYRRDWSTEVWSVAAPVRDIAGEIKSAIGVAGPANRFRTNLRPYSSAVVAAANALSRTGICIAA